MSRSDWLIKVFQFMPDGRKQNGGSRPRSGRKSKAEEMGLMALLDKCWSKKDREDCILALALTASDPKSDDRMDAVKLLMSYAFGKPKEKIEHGGADGLPIEIIVRHVERPTDRA